MRILISGRRYGALLAATGVLLAVVASGSAAAAVTNVCSGSELSAAIDRAGPGDRIVMCNKTWVDTQIEFSADGREGEPITITTQSPGGVIMTGTSSINLGGSFLVIDGLRFEGTSDVSGGVIDFRISSSKLCNDCRVTNVTFINYNPSNLSENSKWIRVYGMRNRVDHSHFKGKANEGAVLQIKRPDDGSPGFHQIDHNLIEDRPDMDSYADYGDTLEVGTSGYYAKSDSRSVIEFNYLRNLYSDYEALTVKSSANTIRYNVIEKSRGTLSLRQGHRNLVLGNYILGRGDPRAGGIRIQGTEHTIVSNYVAGVNPNGSSSLAGIGLYGGNDEVRDDGGEGSEPYRHYEEAVDVLVAHNTIVDSGDSIVIGGGRQYSPRRNELISNIVDGGRGTAIDDDQLDDETTFSSNLVSAESVGISDPGVKAVDPQLVTDGAGIERPSDSSPAIDSAPEIDIDMTDMDGQKRNGAPEIGADEVVSNVSPRGPIPICAVGPRNYRVGLPAACDSSAWNNMRPNPPRLLAAD